MSPPPIYSIVVPTRRRLASLNRALTSLKVQRGVAPAHVELIVADNDERPSARETVAEFARTAPWFVLYVHEPSPGVANVRNAAMARVRGQFVAFLDDDQEACEDWLCEMAAAQKRFHADAVFGLVKGAVPEALGWRKPYLEKFFSRLGPAEAQVVEEPYGCGSSLIRRAAMPDPLAPFNVSRNQIGGEDDMLFDAMKQAGARFAWSPEAWVWEHPDPD
ncbi:MAG: glycosyltransferase family 2 protein, partial [Caulobacteraceae bacterium]